MGGSLAWSCCPLLRLVFFLTIAPERIPVHYNIRGEINRWGSKYEYLMFPLLTAISAGVMSLVGMHVRKKGEEFNEKIVVGLNIWMLVLFNGMWLFFLLKALKGESLTGKLPELGMKVLLILLFAFFIPAGNLMPKIGRNSALGLRTKWSMADDICWQKSQRFAGFLMVGTGIIGAAAVAVAPSEWGVYVMLLLLVAMTVASICGTYRIYKGEHS